MKVNLEWLKDYVEIKESPEVLADALTMAGLEVEGYETINDQTVFEVSVTPNRPDWLCHIGVAREIAALFSRDLKIPDLTLNEDGSEVEAQTSIDIEDPDGCPRYSGRVLTGIKIGASPDYVIERLESVGVRSINNVVDATNYVMLELGQPLHAFDYHRLTENRIVVRKAKKGEILETLDGQKRELIEEDLLICDGQGPVALAGIMGGLSSEVHDDTRDLLLESACFDPTTIRRSSKRFGLSTEASYRFERGTDPSGTARAVDRLAKLVSQWSGGTVCKGVFDAHPKPEEPGTVSFSLDRVRSYLGIEISEEKITEILNSLELKPEIVNDNGTISVPPFRRDLKIEEDVIEEIARIFGYDNVPVSMPVGTTVPVMHLDMDVLESELRKNMEGLGYSEAVTYSFIDHRDLSRIGLTGGPVPVSILNPISDEMEVMRTSLMPGLLKSAGNNARRQIEDIALYEIGRVFMPCEECILPEERVRLAGILVGSRYRKSWHTEETEADFFDIKGTVESLLNSRGISDISFNEMEIPYMQQGQSAWVMVGDKPLGPVGTVHPAVREKYRLKHWAGCFELDLNHMESIEINPGYEPVPQYPGMLRDMAVVVPEAVSSIEVEESIRDTGQNLVMVKLFDLYDGKGIPDGQKSLAYALTFQSGERTLTDDEVETSMKKIVSRLAKRFGAVLR